MATFTSFFHPTAERISLWLHGPPDQSQDRPAVEPGPGHAPGHRHLGPPPRLPFPKRSAPRGHEHHPAWLATGGRVDRLRRNERHGDESQT